MKVLVTGGEGYFGSWLIPALEKDYEVDSYDKQNGDDMFDTEGLEKRMAGCDAVIHLAALPHFKPEIPESDFQRVNVEGTKVVFQAAVKAGVKRFIFTSSGALYGYDAGWIPTEERPIPLSHTGDYGKMNFYARSKVDAERFLQEASVGISEKSQIILHNLGIFYQELPEINIVILRVNWPQGAPPPNTLSGRTHDWTTEGFAAKIYIAALVADNLPEFSIFNCTHPDANGGDPMMEINNRQEILGV